MSSHHQWTEINSAIVKGGLKGCKGWFTPEPMSLVEWADENFYLSAESSYIEGRWETLPFQLAPMNAIGHSDIIYVDFVKSARVGYSQMIRAAVGYFAEHKQRNQLLFQPTDGAASSFMKSSIESMIRDVPCVKKLAPWIGKKHRDNTLDTKRFSNSKQLWVLGGAAAKNYREKSVDVVYYDELAAFEQDVEKEGSPTLLGDKRIEGSVFPKSVRGSTPKITETCQITKAASEADCYFKFHLPCPHCDKEQVLEWGGPDCDYGFKWQNGDPNTVAYLCKHCNALIANTDLLGMQEKAVTDGQHGAWRSECGTWTKDGLTYYLHGKMIEPPEHVAFHIWTAYSTFTTWLRIVRDFIKSKDDPSKLKTWVNTTKGETWDEETGEKFDPDSLFARREHYQSECPVDSCVLTAAVDVQDDRFEIEIKAWVSDEESYALSYRRLYGDLSRPDIWERLYEALTRTFKTPSGLILDVRMACIDSGGHYTDEVYSFCRRHGQRRFVPIKGYSQAGKPVAAWPRKPNSKGVYLVMVGTDTGKEIISARMVSTNPGAGYLHYPVSEEFDRTFFDHLTNERKKTIYRKGRKVIEWDAGGRRNEPFDLENYNLVAIRLLQQHFGISLNNIKTVTNDSAKPLRAKSRLKL